MRITETKLRKLIKRTLIEEQKMNRLMNEGFLSSEKVAVALAAAVLAIVGFSHMITGSSADLKAAAEHLDDPGVHQVLTGEQIGTLQNVSGMTISPGTEMTTILNQHYKRKGRRV